MPPIRFTIHGQPASKANSREIVIRKQRKPDGTMGQRPAVIKSESALLYEREALRQIPPKARLRLEGPVRVTLRIFYATELPDLDESIVLDVLQDRWQRVEVPGKTEKERVLVQNGVYRNDRQVREKHVYHGIDKLMPRTEVEIEPLQMQQEGLALAA